MLAQVGFRFPSSSPSYAGEYTREKGRYCAIVRAANSKIQSFGIQHRNRPNPKFYIPVDSDCPKLDGYVVPQHPMCEILIELRNCHVASPAKNAIIDNFVTLLSVNNVKDAQFAQGDLVTFEDHYGSEDTFVVVSHSKHNATWPSVVVIDEDYFFYTISKARLTKTNERLPWENFKFLLRTALALLRA